VQKNMRKGRKGNQSMKRTAAEGRARGMSRKMAGVRTGRSLKSATGRGREIMRERRCTSPIRKGKIAKQDPIFRGYLGTMLTMAVERSKGKLCKTEIV